jgi:hypothetical protein
MFASGRFADLTWPWRAWMGRPGRNWGDPVLTFMGQYPLFVGVGVAMSVTFPFVLVCLPTTRARAKVRLGHVARAALYQLGWVVPLTLAKTALVLCGAVQAQLNTLLAARSAVPGMPGMYQAPARSPDWADRLYRASWSAGEGIRGLLFALPPLWAGLVAAWLCWWWWVALRRGFRLEEARRVYWAAMIPTIIAVAIVLAVHPDFLWMVIR